MSVTQKTERVISYKPPEENHSGIIYAVLLLWVLSLALFFLAMNASTRTTSDSTESEIGIQRAPYVLEQNKSAPSTSKDHRANRYAYMEQTIQQAARRQ